MSANTVATDTVEQTVDVAILRDNTSGEGERSAEPPKNLKHSKRKKQNVRCSAPAWK